MKLENEKLDEWMAKIHPKQFPSNGTIDYSKRYQGIKEYLDNEVHPHINAMTLTFDDDIYLTKHGTEHIDVVIERVGQLANTQKNDIELNPYEVYLLLVAIQFHDTGHIKNGRKGHEVLASTIMTQLGVLLGNDTIEKKTIYQIAEAHGGRKANGRKDKIEDLPNIATILGKPVRVQMLAALLRFGDELADDSSRANKLLMNSGLLQPGSIIFHQYASSLHSVEVNHSGGEIILNYLLDRNQVHTKFDKKTDAGVIQVYLIDEIYERLFKMYLECIYCMRFIPYAVRINTISAKITFTENDSFVDFSDPIAIKLTEKGYPKIIPNDLYDLCPESLIIDGKKIDGLYLDSTLKH